MHATEPSPICEGELCRPDLQNTPGNTHRKTIYRSASPVKWRKDLGLATCTRCNTNYRALAFVEQFRSCRDNGLVHHIPQAVQEVLSTLPVDATRSLVAGPQRNQVLKKLGREPGACTVLWATYLDFNKRCLTAQLHYLMESLHARLIPGDNSHEWVQTISRGDAPFTDNRLEFC